MAWRWKIGAASLIAFALVIAPAVAWSQSTTSTDCHMVGDTEHCDSQTTAQSSGVHVDFAPISRVPDFGQSYANGYARGQALAAQREADRQAAIMAQQAAQDRAQAEADRQLAHMQAVEHQQAEDRSFERSRRIGALGGQGRCQEARAVPLEDILDPNEKILIALVELYCPSAPARP